MVMKCEWPQAYEFENESGSLDPDQWHVDRMLREEPHLRLVRANDRTHDEVVRAGVIAIVREPGHRAGLLENHFVRVQKPRDLCRHDLASLGRTRYQRRLGNVMGPGPGDSSQALDPFRDGVDELRLFLEVLVEQEM